MIIPLSPVLARDFGASGLQVGLLISVYSLAQFFSAPLWGRWSDRIGRKPVLLAGLAGTAAAHLLFAFSVNLTTLFLSRAIAGIFGGTIGVGLASIADLTNEKERSKNMGLVGLAFGLGFTLGPALGALFIFLGKSGLPPFGVHSAALGAALTEALNFLFCFLFLKESRGACKAEAAPAPVMTAPVPTAPAKARAAAAGEEADFRPSPSSAGGFLRAKLSFSRPPPSLIIQSLKTPVSGAVLLISFLLWTALAQIEPTLILLVQDEFGWTKTGAYCGFAYIGFLMAFSQGFLVRKLIPRYGEKQMSGWGLSTAAFGLFLMGVSVLLNSAVGGPTLDAAATGLFSNISLALALLGFAVTLFSIGHSFASASLQGALSLLNRPAEQGRIFGVHQSLTSIARIVGPAAGGRLYDFHRGNPFFTASALALTAFFVFRRTASRRRAPLLTASRQTDFRQTGLAGSAGAAGAPAFPETGKTFSACASDKNRKTVRPAAGELLVNKLKSGDARNNSLSNNSNISPGASIKNEARRETNNERQPDRQNEKPLRLFQSAALQFFQNLRNHLSNDRRRRKEEEEIYSIDLFQLENLLLKKIHFHLFKTEDFPIESALSPVVKEALQKAQTVLGEKAALSALRGRGKEEPIVLVCATGAHSQKTAQKLREKGCFNAYFLKDGANSLSLSFLV